uniref:Uncharacterized protein n=1 Tax=Strongyloides stercoralis TaxID=6248 RepID=A0A0K0E872_STRER
MSKVVTVVGVVLFIIVLLVIGGIIGFCYYTKKCNSKKNDKRERSNSQKKSSSSKDKSSSSKSSSRRSSRLKTKSNSSRGSSSSSDKKTNSSRQKTLSTESKKTPSTSSPNKNDSKSKSKKKSKPLVHSPKNNGFPGEIKVAFPTKRESKLNNQGSNTILKPVQIEQNSKKSPSNTPKTSSTVKIDNNSKVENNNSKTSMTPEPKKINDVIEIKPHVPIIFEGCPTGKQISNDLLKYKTNTHYISPTSVTVPKETPEVSVANSSKPVDEIKSKPTMDKLGKDNASVGSLLTTNNITYNNVNIMVNNTEDTDINEAISTAIEAISDSNINISNLPGLPPMKSKEDDKNDDDWVKI